MKAADAALSGSTESDAKVHKTLSMDAHGIPGEGVIHDRHQLVHPLHVPEAPSRKY